MIVKCPECKDGCPLCHYTTFVCTEKVPMTEDEALKILMRGAGVVLPPVEEAPA